MPAGWTRAGRDITYIRTWEGWLFLATVIDIASRRVVGFAMADHLRTELVADALANAVAARGPAPGVVFHSDRGCQYTSAAFATLADDCQVVLSLGRTGQCWDNALAESFFASLKGELIHTRPWPTRAAARRATVEYIGWYNSTRLHSTLGYRSPAEFETSAGKDDLQQIATSHQPCPSKRGNPNRAWWANEFERPARPRSSTGWVLAGPLSTLTSLAGLSPSVGLRESGERHERAIGHGTI